MLAATSTVIVAGFLLYKYLSEPGERLAVLRR